MEFKKEVFDKYKKKGEFVLSSGAQSNTYYDLKEAMGEPQNLLEFIHYIEPDMKNIDVIVGIAYGGIPLAVALSLHTNVPFAILRKEQKKYAMWHRLEGYQKKGRVLLLDDVSTTGNSIRDAKKYLEDEGYVVIRSEVLLDRNNG